MRTSISAGLIALILLAGCDGGRTTRTGGGGGGGARSRSDGAVRDASDASQLADGGLDEDGAVVDAGADPLADSGPGTAHDAGPAADAGEGPRDAGHATPDSGARADAGFAPDASVPPLPVCVHSCTTAADCAIAGSPLYTAAHYRCVANACEYLGCTSDTECHDTFRSMRYACRQPAPYPTPVCIQTCAAPADCATPSPLLDADNYRCTSGLCEWTGCNSSSECAAAYNDPSWECATVQGATFRSCMKTCTTAASCAQGTAAYDADNYACTRGLCEWRGCRNDGECRSTYNDNAYICR